MLSFFIEGQRTELWPPSASYLQVDPAELFKLRQEIKEFRVLTGNLKLVNE